jgi:predicted ABC-type ATPase
MGRHSIPERDIRRRYSRALANLPEAMGIAHQTALYGNISVSHVKLIEVSGGNIAFNDLDETNFTHRELSSAVGTAFGLTPDTVFKTRPK